MIRIKILVFTILINNSCVSGMCKELLSLKKEQFFTKRNLSLIYLHLLPIELHEKIVCFNAQNGNSVRHYLQLLANNGEKIYDKLEYGYRFSSDLYPVIKTIRLTIDFEMSKKFKKSLLRKLLFNRDLKATGFDSDQFIEEQNKFVEEKNQRIIEFYKKLGFINTPNSQVASLIFIKQIML